MSYRRKRDERGKLYSTRGWGVVNKRINASRQHCPRCGKNTYIYTKESGRFCTICRYKPEDELNDNK